MAIVVLIQGKSTGLIPLRSVQLVNACSDLVKAPAVHTSCFTFTIRMNPAQKTGWSMLLAILVMANMVNGQRPVQDTIVNYKSNSSVNSKARDVEKSLEAERPSVTAAKYEGLAAELSAKGSFSKAEDYLKSALDIYKKEKNKDKIASVSRELARVQEQQKKYAQAISGYQEAATCAPDKNSMQLNSNDILRLQNPENLQQQIKYLECNVDILESEGKKDEAAAILEQKAEVQLRAYETTGAIDSYTRALESKLANPEETIELKSKLSRAYADNNQLDKAIEVANNSLADALQFGGVSSQIIQKTELAELLSRKGEDATAMNLLEEAYETARENGHTREAKEVIQVIAAFYADRGDLRRSLEWHERFFIDFEELIRADSSIVDAKIFEMTEGRIKQLEKEQALKDELFVKTNRFNLILVGSVALLFVLMGVLIKTIYSVRTRNKRIALQSLRREMNPHFIFNSLNSVNHFIAENNELEANKYLTSYSALMRNMMESSNADFVLLSSEIEQLRKYLSLEHLRFRDKFDFEIIVDESLDTESVMVPNMLLQPHLENAIWHGLRYRESKGMLKLTFSDVGTFVKVSIEDNGIGVERSQALKTQNQRVYESRGLGNVGERIRLLNELYGKKISFTISGRPDGEGTIVEVFMSKASQAL